MAEGLVHKNLKRLALYFLKEKVTDIVANEVDFANSWSVADAVGLNLKRREVRVVEVKASKGDFTRDKKLFGDKTSYFYHAHYSYIMCPTNVIKPEEVPYGYGLLWVDEYDKIEVIKKPIKNTARLKTLFDTTLRRTCRSLTNTHLYHEENKEAKDETQGRFKRNADILLVAARCPNCKKHAKELIKKDVTKTIKCKCKTEIDITKAKTREITGFNKTFIDKINKLNDTE
ncbi:gp692 [Bacillus phage G]|uniref:Gp692 n=1 Tax=Bacillus phage G TaxID=2884420 RepID=G3MB72_9CAUD|nr:gp692 [Bacillus phage G]AEO93935.1 gp692 [Bacillus phage G]